MYVLKDLGMFEGLSEGLFWNVIEKQKPMMAPGIWAPVPQRIAFPFTKEEKTIGEAGEQRELKALVRDRLNGRCSLDIGEKAAEQGFEVQWTGLDRKSNLGSLVCTKIFLTAGSLFKICVQD